MNRDPHQALKSEIIAQARSSQVELVLARLQWSKNEIGYSLHVNPFSYSSYGLQVTDFLSYLGFHRSQCAFMAGRQCFVRWVDEGFDLEHFKSRFDAAYASLTDGARDLESCGFFLEQPEGWGYFHGKPSGTRARDASMSGDGHTAMKIEHMKQSDDANFMFKFSWLETAHQRGWVIHYRPKHLPLSSELGSVFEFLGLKQFESCPEFDFDDCYWRSIGFVSRGDSPFRHQCSSSTPVVRCSCLPFFARHRETLERKRDDRGDRPQFSPFAKPAERLAADIEKKVERPKDRRQNLSN